MIDRVEVIEADDRIEFEREIYERIRGKKVKDIKFSVNPKIRPSYSASYSSGERYYAIVIYEE